MGLETFGRPGYDHLVLRGLMGHSFAWMRLMRLSTALGGTSRPDMYPPLAINDCPASRRAVETYIPGLSHVAQLARLRTTPNTRTTTRL